MPARSITGFLATVFFAATAVLIAPGCGHSLEGDCNLVCQQQCETFDTCKLFPGFIGSGSADECRGGCPQQCSSYANAVNAECDRHVALRSDRTDVCLDALVALDDACAKSDPYGDFEELIDVQVAQHGMTVTCSVPLYECN